MLDGLWLILSQIEQLIAQDQILVLFLLELNTKVLHSFSRGRGGWYSTPRSFCTTSSLFQRSYEKTCELWSHGPRLFGWPACLFSAVCPSQPTGGRGPRWSATGATAPPRLGHHPTCTKLYENNLKVNQNVPTRPPRAEFHYLTITKYNHQPASRRTAKSKKKSKTSR